VDSDRVSITLTDVQKDILSPLFAAVATADEAGKPVLLIGQISADCNRAVFAIMPHETGMAVVAITNPNYIARARKQEMLPPQYDVTTAWDQAAIYSGSGEPD